MIDNVHHPHSPSVFDTGASGALLNGDSTPAEVAYYQISPVIPVNEGMYDSGWATNMANAAQANLVSGGIDDAWKVAVLSAYANVNPQLALYTTTSLVLGSNDYFGPSNSYTNQVRELRSSPVSRTDSFRSSTG